ncbi:hypothetical protein [Falsiroseomonas sp. HW251]|uniref:hypothetical protein n=1 Tax=Falsiroseomonas sp. HW251 TaxID=3390998 RepID=UPI003D315435
MRKPNYNMERKDRERAKQAKAAAKLEKRAAKGPENGQSDASSAPDHFDPQGAEKVRSDN